MANVRFTTQHNPEAAVEVPAGDATWLGAKLRLVAQSVPGARELAAAIEAAVEGRGSPELALDDEEIAFVRTALEDNRTANEGSPPSFENLRAVLERWAR